MPTVRWIIRTMCWSASTSWWPACTAASNLIRETQTERILRAVANPYTTILGHMTGRQLLRRPGYEVDIAKDSRSLRRAWRGRGDQRQSLAS